MLKLDVTKAYDSVDRTRLWSLLSYMQLDCDLLALIKFATAESRVLLADAPH
jgi:hypothetical protein